MTKKEHELLVAFRKLRREKQDFYHDSICECADEMERSAPKLKLVSNSSTLLSSPGLYGDTEDS
jgi:hypothetical protein